MTIYSKLELISLSNVRFLLDFIHFGKFNWNDSLVFSKSAESFFLDLECGKESFTK
jgi:hypothetical protein